MRTTLAAAVAVAIVALGGGTASAADLNCSDFETPIKISNGYDPYNLDRDGDGIGCDSNPGEAVATDLYADLRGDETATPAPQLAETGWGPDEHPVRWIAFAGALTAGGIATVVATGRRKVVRNES